MVCMIAESWPDWLVLEVDAALEAIVDPSERALGIHRVLKQYIPAALGARTPGAEERAWSALHYYLTALPAPRKRWHLTNDESAEAVARIKAIAMRLR